MGTTCTITIVYDQSGHGNFVEAETPDSTVGGHAGMTAANATQESLMVGGHKVYSLYMKTSQAYWRDGSKSGMPTGSAPQGIYMVTSGKHYSSGCCFDYGNGETSRMYVAGPTMDAINFSNCTIWGTGAGAGPWVMADLEGGLYVKGGGGQNTAVPTLTYTYVTAMEKNNGTGTFALKGADATTGSLEHVLQRRGSPGIQPGQEARVHRSRQRRRLLLQQQHGEPGHLLRRGHRRRLSVRRDRRRDSSEHRDRRLRQVAPFNVPRREIRINTSASF